MCEKISMEYLGNTKPINHSQPLVSVCVPTFQHRPYISQCLESILMQKTDFPFEILIGEDFSTDGTREICMSYAEKYPEKIRLFLRDGKNKFIRNGKKTGRYNHLGLYKEARGKYVCIIDGDDYWLNPEKLSHEVELMEKFPEASICITQTQIEGVSTPTKVTEDIKLYTPKELKYEFYKGHISGWMMRNHMDEFLANPISIKAPVLDNPLFNFYKEKGKVILSPELTSFYRKNPNGTYSSNSRKRNQMDRFYLNWHLYQHVHKDTLLYLRTLLFMAKRYFANFVFNKTTA